MGVREVSMRCPSNLDKSNVKLSKIRQRGKDKYFVISLI